MLRDGGPTVFHVAVVLMLVLSVPIGAQPIAELDSDGDRLPDNWKECNAAPDGVELPGGEPGRMTVYLQIQYADGIEPLSEDEKRFVERSWAEMAIQNPDGTSGVDLHVDDTPPHGGPVDESISLDGSIADLEAQSAELRGEYYTQEWMGERRGIYHQVLLVEMPSDHAAGIGNTPGMFAVVDGRYQSGEDGATPRARLLTHELLHNVVGEIEPEFRTGDSATHTDEGWLSPGVADDPDQEFLPERIARQIEHDGFADHSLYQHYRPAEPVTC